MERKRVWWWFGFKGQDKDISRDKGKKDLNWLQDGKEKRERKKEEEEEEEERTNDDGLIEKEDIPVGLIGTRYFKPYYFDFELIADNDLLDLLDENPLKVFSFQDVNNVTYKGIAEKVGIEPNYNKNQTYKLLCTSDTDLKPLIDYYGG